MEQEFTEHDVQADRALVIDAPVTLAAGDNFFDQEPFCSIMQKCVETHGVDLIRLRKLLFSYVTHRDDWIARGGEQYLTRNLRSTLKLDSVAYIPYESALKSVDNA